MKNLFLAVGLIFILGPADAMANDASFLKRFSRYRSQNKISTYDTARVFATHQKSSVEKILKRYISASLSVPGAYEPSLVLAIDAFKESGMSHQAALQKASDAVGQMTDTLDTIYRQTKPQASNRVASTGSSGRGPASAGRGR